MLGLSQAQGIILAVGGAIFVAIAGAILVLRGRARQEADIPNAMRPGPSDPTWRRRSCRSPGLGRGAGPVLRHLDAGRLAART
jgi:hypothetical protein